MLQITGPLKSPGTAGIPGIKDPVRIPLKVASFKELRAFQQPWRIGWRPGRRIAGTTGDSQILLFRLSGAASRRGQHDGSPFEAVLPHAHLHLVIASAGDIQGRLTRSSVARALVCRASLGSP